MAKPLVISLNQNFLDLSPYALGPLRNQKVEYDYNSIDSEDPFLQRPQQTLSQLFRANLVRTVGLCEDPLALLGQETSTGSPRFEELNHWLLNLESLRDAKKARVLFLLNDLGLHSQVINLVSSGRVISHDNLWQSHIDYAFAVSNYYTQIDREEPPTLTHFQRALAGAPKNSMIRVSIGFSLAIISALHRKRDIEALKGYINDLRASIDDIAAVVSPFTLQLLQSRCYRASAFLPMHQNDQVNMVKEMDIAESLAETLVPTNASETLLFHENWIPILESRTKEAIIVEDYEVALNRATRAVASDPLDSRLRIELGQVYFAQADYEHALEAYTQGIRLGPPGLAIALHMAGRACEGLQEKNRAADYYLQALGVDPLQTSSVERLLALAPELSDASFLPWLEAHSASLDTYE